MKADLRFYQPQWEEYTLPAVPRDYCEKIILVCDNQTAAVQWASCFKNQNISVDFLIDLSFKASDRLQEYISHGPGNRYRVIYPCTRLNEEMPDRENSYYRLLGLVKALDKQAIDKSAFILLTDCVFAERAGLQAHPVNSLVVSAAQTIALEYPNRHIGTLDYQSGLFWHNSEYRRQVMDIVLNYAPQEPVLVIAEGTIRKPAYALLDVPSDFGFGKICSDDYSKQGAILITGGLGGLGPWFADYFARQGIRHIYLASRRGNPPAALSAADTATRDKMLETIRQLGAQVHIETMDCTEETSVRSFFERTSGQGVHITGVVHAAAVNRSAYVSQRQAEISAEVLGPKVVGSNLLLQYASAFSVDFMMLCSSLASVIPRVGMASYSAGNFYLDRLASFARYDSGCRVMSLNLDTVINTGMAGRFDNLPQKLSLPSVTGLTQGIAPEQLTAIIHQVLQYDLPQVLVCNGDLEERINAGRRMTKKKFEQLVLSMYQKRK